ncbi:hypothetical protein F4810DRAFT_179890 [Camillea tinctor]|nr:hypothetical protein F4810DRAFT_179890 [Camillea tinctor]
MKEAQLWDEFCKEARFTSDYTLMCDKDLNAFIEASGSDWGPSRPEIDRSKLRQILTESLPDETIKWGHRLQRVEEGNKLVFEHTTESGFDLIVGYEGAWSKVRNFTTTVTPHYTGIGYNELSIPNAEQTAPRLFKIVRGGNVFAHSNGRRFSVQQIGDGSLRIGNGSVRPENWMQSCKYDPYDLEQTKKAILEELHDWCPQLREAVEKAQGKCEPRNLYSKMDLS